MWDRVFDALNDDALLEELSAIEHSRWAHWQQYMHSQCEQRSDGALLIPPDLAARWDSQIRTSYAELSESEKESDREQVRRYLPVIAAALDVARRGGGLDGDVDDTADPADHGGGLPRRRRGGAR